jgi:hypothetical protein
VISCVSSLCCFPTGLLVPPLRAGTSLLIFTNIVSSLPSSFGQTLKEAGEKGDSATVLPVFFGGGRIQDEFSWTHSSKAPGFISTPEPMRRKSGFEVCFFKCNLYRYA